MVKRFCDLSQHKYKIILISLLLSMTFCTIFYLNKILYSDSINTKNIKLDSEKKEYFASDNWHIYSSQMKDKIDKFKPLTVKIIFELEHSDNTISYVVSKKRHKEKQNSKKNRRWEFPGGRIDSDENAITALLRELQEEDESLILFLTLDKQIKKQSKKLKFKNITYKKHNRHTIFKTKISLKSWNELETFHKYKTKKNKETYGFFLLSKNDITFFKKNKKEWTPKSRKLLKALDRS